MRLGEEEMIVGDTWQFNTTVSDFPASAGWTLTYRLVPEKGAGAAITFNNSGISGDDYVVQVAAATTAAYAAGDYSWAAYVLKSGERHTVDKGEVTLVPDPGVVSTPYDSRSFARKMLDQIEAALLAFQDASVKSYTIGSRSMTREDVPNILVMRDRWLWEVKNENDTAQIAAGLGNPRNVGVRFSRV